MSPLPCIRTLLTTLFIACLALLPASAATEPDAEPTLRPTATSAPEVATPPPLATPSPPPRGQGVIMLRLNVGGADLALNGSELQFGAGPDVRFEQQLPGPFRIEISRPGYVSRTVTGRLNPGQQKRMVINLEPQPRPRPAATTLPSATPTPRPTPVVRPTPAPTPPAASALLRVSKSGPADYRTIGEALRRVRAGGRILVGPGLYREGLQLTRSVEIVGDGPPADIIIESTDAPCVLMKAEHSVLRGLTLRGRAGQRGGKQYCLEIPRGKLVVEDCDLTSDSLAVVAIYGAAAHPVFRRTRIHGSTAGGISIWKSGRATIEDCDLFGNALAGVEIKDGGEPRLLRTRVRDGRSSGVLVWRGGRGTVDDCDIVGNGYSGVTIQAGGYLEVRGSRVKANHAFGVSVDQEGRGAIEASDLTGNARGAWDDPAGRLRRRSNRQ